MLPGSKRCAIDQTASTLTSRTLLTPFFSSVRKVSATPGRQTSKASTLWWGRCAARAAVASPIPEPISTTSGASRPNRSAQENCGVSTASSGTHHSPARRSQTSAWASERRLPRRL